MLVYVYQRLSGEGVVVSTSEGLTLPDAMGPPLIVELHSDLVKLMDVERLLLDSQHPAREEAERYAAHAVAQGWNSAMMHLNAGSLRVKFSSWEQWKSWGEAIARAVHDQVEQNLHDFRKGSVRRSILVYRSHQAIARGFDTAMEAHAVAT